MKNDTFPNRLCGSLAWKKDFPNSYPPHIRWILVYALNSGLFLFVVYACMVFGWQEQGGTPFKDKLMFLLDVHGVF